ncbi:hypothetical protein CVIRNUC_004159 [Coccomyxa viridis]|uniref:Uncharacterized protein n=1 Tax=Coccomyxa viridis TaxID=1274662 RepID=A0AAV1I1P9_9CHLO|nr:hypothetical protein CVIRNUC_004159 [Coccomyxa viridis]
MRMGGSFPGHEGVTILDHLRLTGSGGSKARSYTTTHALDSPLEDIEISIRELRGQLNSIESTQQELAKLETGILDDLEALHEESDSTRDMLQDIAATLLALYKAVNSLRSAAPKGSLDSPNSPPNSTDQPQQASTKPSQL